jgi:hypothetical protein
MDISPMSSGVFLTMLFILVGLPVLSWAATSMFKRWLRHVEALHRVSVDQTPESIAHQAAKMERLEQRMSVIERILTDRSTHLSEEIERLRDAPVN